jgi:prevent-host-death family protein
MAKMWVLQEAKNKLSQLVKEAQTEGPQIITKRGVETAVVISYAEFQKLKKTKQSVVDFFRSSPLMEVELDLTREVMPERENIEL